jgi:hypothetical protein
VLAGERNKEIEGERAVEEGLCFPLEGTELTRLCGTRQADVGRDVARPRVRARMQADHVGAAGGRKFARCLGA